MKAKCHAAFLAVLDYKYHWQCFCWCDMILTGRYPSAIQLASYDLEKHYAYM